ncbi:MAG: HVO_2901 family zinc finger protein [Haloferacaceae archaeon]
MGMLGAGLTAKRGRDTLVCRNCGAEFPEGRATEDGWHYRCPECEDAEGIGEGLRRP